jgi:drug/metabolite transporter (DMT)-like permease
MEKDNDRVGHILMGVVVLTWGINFGVAKSAYQDIPPVLFAAIRFTISGLLIFLVTFWRERSISIQKQDLKMVAAVGGLGLGLYQILWSLGLDLTTASNSALILSTQPLLGALYMDLIKKESVGKRQYLGMVLALVGVILVILKPTLKLRFSLETLSGDLLTLVAGVCAAIFFSAWSKPLLRIYSPLRLMGYCMLIGSSVLWLATFLLRQSVVWDQIGVKAWGSLGYAILFSGVVGHTLWYVGIGRIGVTRALVYLYFIPVCAVLFNFSLMGEEIFIQQLLGGVLILWGVHRSLRT